MDGRGVVGGKRDTGGDMDKGKKDDFEKLDLETEYRTEIVRLPMSELFASMPEAYSADWEWDRTQQAPTPEDIAELLGAVARHAETMPEPSCGKLLALMDGCNGAMTGDEIDCVRLLFPLRVDSSGAGALRLTLPAELLDAWPSFPEKAGLPGRIQRLANLLRCMDAVANLYGAIRLEDALALLHGFGLWEDPRDLPLLDSLEMRSLERKNPGAFIHEGVVYLSCVTSSDGIRYKDARKLLRIVEGMPRWVPATAEELLAWSDPAYVEDTPANAAVMIWTMENFGADDPVSPRELVAEASLRVRASAEADPYIALFDEGYDGEYGGPPPGLRDQFVAAQRRWIGCGRNESEVLEWEASPEGQAWSARRKAENASRKAGKKNKKHGKRR